MNVSNLAKWVDELAGSIEQLTRRVSGMKSTEVDVTQVQESGTKIATVTVNDEDTDIYAPEYSITTDVAFGKNFIGTFDKDGEAQTWLYQPFEKAEDWYNTVEALTANTFVVPVNRLERLDGNDFVAKSRLNINCFTSNTVMSVSLASDMTNPSNPVPMRIKDIKDVRLHFVTQSTGGVKNYGLLGNPNARNASVSNFNIQKAATGETTISFKPIFQSGDSMTVYVDIEYTQLPDEP